MKGLTLDDEGNPFLGMRGIRLSLLKPDVFRVQLRALCRAAVRGNLKIMLPMVATPRELAQGRAHLAAVIADLAARKVPMPSRRSASWWRCRRPPSPSTASMRISIPSAPTTSPNM